MARPSTSVQRTMGLARDTALFGHTVADVPETADVDDESRNLDCVEIFAGRGTVASAAADDGKSSATFDIKNDTAEDLTTPTGFWLALSLVLRLRAGGLLWLAPVCSSWGWMNAARCKRNASNNYEGDTTVQAVSVGNIMARPSAFLTMVAALRDVRVGLENPVGSKIFKYGPVAKVTAAWEMCRATSPRCPFSTEPYGQRWLKTYEFWATGPWIRRVHAPCVCPGREHYATVQRKRGPDGKEAVTGIAESLVGSAEYPPALGRRIWACSQGIAIDAGTPTPPPPKSRKIEPTSVQRCTPSVQRPMHGAEPQRPASSVQHAGAVRSATWRTPSATTSDAHRRGAAASSWQMPAAMGPPAPSRRPEARSLTWLTPAATTMHSE